MSVLLYEKRNQIAYITLNRPEKLNALNQELISELERVLADYRDDSSLLVAIMTGSGRAFSTGADLKELVAKGGSAGSTSLSTLFGQEMWKPMIAAIDGYALAGGFVIALECDIRIATERSKLGDIATRVGSWDSLRAYSKMPFGEALYMHLTGTPFSAADAHRIGLVHKVVPDREALMQEANAIAEEIKLAAPLALQAIKRLAHTSLMKTGADVDVLSRSLIQQLSQSEDAKEGPRAFAEKRKPVWKMR
ncbi:MAG: enoyl-CoA hydratase/isomerase family protein [Chloroflexi bacterium]|nr:enoyl-CoA hydratase/isomerase family protein [Chloroflexota bacterium]